MKNQQKKSPSKKSTPKQIPDVKRSTKATGVNENQKSIFSKRSNFADELGTSVPDPNN